MASSNLPNVSIIKQNGINVKDIVTYDKIFIEEKSVNEITKRLSWRVTTIFQLVKPIVLFINH